MAAWVGLLRGVNVGGHNILPMKEFADGLQRAGFENVKTYIQSGNVVFSSSAVNPQSLADRISETVNENRGFKPSVFVLNATDLANVISKNPYPAAEQNHKSLHVFFLGSLPRKADLSLLNELKSGSESFKAIGKALYLHVPDGLARSKLAAGIGKVLRVDATARNWRTIMKLHELAQNIE